MGTQTAGVRGERGFTLFEIMMVLAILMIIVGVGLPAMISTVRKGPMRQAISDLEEGFLKARMLAILTGQPAEFIITASDGALEVRSVAEGPSENSGGEFASPVAADVSSAPVDDGGGEERPRTEPLPRFSAKLHPSIAFKQLMVSLWDMLDEPDAAVRFYPNGTCDAFSALVVSETGEERSVALEITTGRARVETLR